MDIKKTLENCIEEASIELDQNEFNNILKVFSQLDDFFSFLDKGAESVKDFKELKQADFPIDIVLDPFERVDTTVLPQDYYMRNSKNITKVNDQTYYTIKKVVGNEENDN